MKNKSLILRLASITTIVLVSFIIFMSLPSITNASQTVDTERCDRVLYVDITGIDNIPIWCSGTVSISWGSNVMTQSYVHGVSQYAFYVPAGVRGTVTPGITWSCSTGCTLTKQTQTYLTMPCGSYYGLHVWISCDEI